MSETQRLTVEQFSPAGLGCGSGPHLHTWKEAAALIKIPPGTLQKMLTARTVQFTQLGKHFLFSDADLEALIASGQRLPASATHTARRRRNT